MSPQEQQLLEDLLFGATSRNQQFEHFESPSARRIHRRARRLRHLHQEISRPEVSWSHEELTNGQFCLSLRQPQDHLMRTVILSREELDLLLHPGW